MDFDVSLVSCQEYEYQQVREALKKALSPFAEFQNIKENSTVVFKTNLVSGADPEKAVTTHPIVLSALASLVTERGAKVIIGDSPGGLYNKSSVEHAYHLSHYNKCVCEGVSLNDDFTEKETTYPEGKVLHSFTYTGYLDKADVIIDVCKLKTHAMMGLSCAVKNMFGTIPGTIKPEYHFRFPSYERFADMLVDLNGYFKPTLAVCDAIVGMEGNGPTAGTPRKIGCLLVSNSTHKLDLLAGSLIGLTPKTAPTLEAALQRGFIPENANDLKVYGDNPDDFVIPDYDNVPIRSGMQFEGASNNVLRSIGSMITKFAIASKPKLQKDLCIGCNKCGNICPAKAITMVKGKAKINRKKCIRCFCCQEFCPKGAMKIHRPLFARLVDKKHQK